jgi:subtilisin family serine protease
MFNHLAAMILLSTIQIQPAPQLPSQYDFKNPSSTTLGLAQAWTKEKGRGDIIVAVIDTGVDCNHPDLQGNVWENPNVPYPSCGMNYIKGTNAPTDYFGHGTHIAGIIASKYNATMGSAGIAPNVKIMALKTLSPGFPMREGQVKSMVMKSLQFAIDNNAKIINISSAGKVFIKEERELIDVAGKKGILVVASASNLYSNMDIEENEQYPASYRLSNLISVGSVDDDNKKLESSNYGESVDVSAPGKNILSIMPNSSYGYMSGTSQAAAIVSGIAALLFSKDPELTPEEVKSIILYSSDKFSSLQHFNKVSGRVNAYKALAMLEAYNKFRKKPTSSVANNR